MEYKLHAYGYLIAFPPSEQKEVIRIYKEYKEKIERLDILRNAAANNITYQRAREDWLEATNEFIGFQKALKALSIRVIEIEGDQ